LSFWSTILVIILTTVVGMLFGSEKSTIPWKTRFLSAPDNLWMAAKSAWVSRERGLAVFAGVFLASLVITTVLAYGVGLSQLALQDSLQTDVFDAKIDFKRDPGNNVTGRTNNSVVWESVCDELTSMDEFSDCGLIFGRQGIRVEGFFDETFLVPQPLNVISIEGPTGDWGNVSFDYPEALESGPPINGDRTLRFYGDGIWDGELGERHAKQVIYGSWPINGKAAADNRSIVLPSQIASKAGVGVNETISYLNFTYVTDSVSFEAISGGLEDCQGEEVIEQSGYLFCRVNMTVRNLTIAAIYEETGPGNPTLLFNPVMVTESVLTDEQRVILMDYDHGYLGVALDRSLLPTSSTADAEDWLENLQEKVKDKTYANGEIEIEYVDLISGTIGFLNIFLGLVQVFDYILMIPIVVLSFSVLIYGLALSLEQRKREIAIHRVLGGTEANLRGMVLLEVFVISTVGWFAGYTLSLLSVPLILDAVGFMSFREGEFDVNATLSFWSTILVIILTIVVAMLFGRSRTEEFLSIEIDEGVRRVTTVKKARTWLHLTAFSIGVLAVLESWIETNEGWWIYGENGIVDNFIWNGLLFILGPFCLWIGGALVLGRIGAAGPRILTLFLGWTPALSDIKRGLSGSSSSEAVNRLAVIMLLTLSIVTLAAVQGYTGTAVDERTASAQTGADLQVQFDEPVTEEQARTEVMLAIQRVDNPSISGIESTTSVGNIFTNKKGEGASLLTWIVFDNHEDTLIWDSQAVPKNDIGDSASRWANDGFTTGESARRLLDLPSADSVSDPEDYEMNLEYNEYTFTFSWELNATIIDTTTTETKVSYMGNHQWVPGLSTAEAEQSIVIGEKTYRLLAGDNVVDSYTSSRWFFELCDQSEDDCGDALRTLSVEVTNGNGVASTQDWSTTHREVERNGGLIFGTQGLLSLQFVVASLASVASAFVFLSLVLTKRKKELAILQAIGASPNQVIRLVLFEILAIIIVSMGLGVLLGLGIAYSFNGFFGIFGFLFQLFLGAGTPINRDLVWPWLQLGLVNLSVLFAVVLALIFTTRRALKSDLAVVLKGE